MTEETPRDAAYLTWVDTLPEIVRPIARKFRPTKVYKMDSGHYCRVHSFDEHEDDSVTLTVSVTNDINTGLAFERAVFGIDPDSLTERLVN